MIKGHGDDLYKYRTVSSNFSSNIFNNFDHSKLFDHLATRLQHIESYPQPEPYSLEQKLAGKLDVMATNVMATNGATEAIYLMAQAYERSMSIIMQPTFSEYADACRLNHHAIRTIKGLEEINAELTKKHKPDTDNTLLWLCNPNNPTGKTINKDIIIQAIQARPDIIFVIDDSYAKYTEQETITAKEAVSFNNVALLRSMTKDYGIPGLRLGYAIGNEKLISRLRSMRMPWSVNNMAIDAGIYLIEHSEEYNIKVSDLCKEREKAAKAFNDMGIKTYQSDTNILLAALPFGTANSLKNFLVERYGILIRDASNFTGLTNKHFRIAMQQRQENDNMIKAVREWITLQNI